MKKIIIFFIIVIIIIVSMFVIYTNYKADYNELQKSNLEYEYYYNKEIDGATLATLINKATDNNIKNNVEQNENGKFLENTQNSINIEIYMSDNDTTYNMETIYNGGINNFVANFNIIKFKCTKVEYHQNRKIKYLYFEQISEV